MNSKIEMKFLHNVFEQQNVCEQNALNFLPELSDGIYETLLELSNVLELLDSFASCYWGCHGEGHLIEALVGRCISSAMAALRLVNFGHYDEALSLTRSIGEIGNLMFLFVKEPKTVKIWYESTDEFRRKNYQPGHIRTKIKNLGSQPPIDEERYWKLCEISVHANPHTIPQAFNNVNIPTMGGYYQERGYALCINEISYAIYILGSCALPFAKIPKDKKDEIISKMFLLEEAIGNIRIDNYTAIENFSETLDSSNQIQEIVDYSKKFRNHKV